VHLAIVSFEFLRGTPPGDVARRLRQWRLAEEMVSAGSRGVLVTERVTPL
jgi:hypothetical protein